MNKNRLLHAIDVTTFLNEKVMEFLYTGNYLMRLGRKAALLFWVL